MNKKIFILLLTLLSFFLFVNTICQNKNDTVDNKNEINTNQILQDLTTEKFYEMININKGNSNYIIVDFRTQTEYNSGYIDGAINIDYYSENLKEQLNSLDKSKIYLIYCRSGNRSGKAMVIMKELGFKTVYNMEGGIIGWNAKSYPLKQ